jgi:hypothetical protein
VEDRCEGAKGGRGAGDVTDRGGTGEWVCEWKTSVGRRGRR